MPGRLSVVAVVAGTVFSAISGSTIATTALLGSLLLPEMLRRGYHPSMAMGPIMAIGGVDMLIPPSALTVLLGSLAGISISGLLVAGVVPGVFLSLLFVGYIVTRTALDPALAPPFEARAGDGLGALAAAGGVRAAAAAHLRGRRSLAMSAGWATPTESAAIGAVATVAHRARCTGRSPGRASCRALLGTAAISGIILFIIVGATTFSQILAFSGATNGLVALVREARAHAGGDASGP